MKGGYFLLDGRFHKEEEAVFTLADLGCHVEGFTEHFRAEHNEVLFLESIAHHLAATASTLGLEIEEIVGADGRLLRKDVSRLLNKNKLYLAARIGIHIYPSGDKIHCILHAEEMVRGYYPLKEPGLLISFYRNHQKETEPVTGYMTSGFLARQGAKRQANEQQRTDQILLNKEGNCCETINGSFAYRNKKMLTFPSAASGGYRCAILDDVVQSARKAGFQTVEKDGITPDELLEAEELFLFDACNGIQKVLGLEDQRYFSTCTPRIAAKLAEMARKNREERIEMKNEK